ncbi:MAG TPA: amidohydrolase [Longimicrobiaceae bacterium]|nr:amidohydrolase [Longimicrobiaceae bacterium]
MDHRAPRPRRILLLTATLGLLALVHAAPAGAQSTASALGAEIDRRATEVQPRVVAWRRDIHQNPELSNRETRTAGIVAAHLRSLGMEVRTGVAHTGVVGILRGGRPGPVVALRADMDALPVTEQVDLPFRSRVRSTYNGQEVGVMHACGHDLHTAMLMGVAQVLAGMRERIPGTVKFIFQPAEEGPPPGEEGGARLMIREGVLRDPRPGAIFGVHVWPQPAGTLHYRELGTMASADNLTIIVRGRQTHGAVPWGGVDPIVVGAQIVTALQTIPSRQVNVTLAPSIVTIGSFQGGVRTNIIPDSVVMLGTVRAFDPAMRRDIHERIRRTAEMIAASAGATARVTLQEGAPVTYNDPALTARMVPTLRRVAGEERVAVSLPITAAEDFGYYQQEIPGMFFFLGIVPEGQDPAKAPANHSPHFFADEGALPVGVRAMAHLAVDYLTGQGGR